MLSVEDAFAVTRAEKRPERVEVRWKMGSKEAQDIIRTTLVAPIIVSDRIVDLLKNRGLSGWRTYPVELFGKDESLIGGFHGLAVHGRCGPVDKTLSVRFHKIMPGGVFPWWRGLFFDPATWDGSDLFMPVGKTGWIFVVEAVRRAFDKAKVRNILFTPLDRLELPKL